MQRLWSAFWAYWKWFCTALVTSFILLIILAAIVTHFQTPEPDKNIRECIDKGGAWDDEANACKSSA